jgi:hypothetical protein
MAKRCRYVGLRHDQRQYGIVHLHIKDRHLPLLRKTKKKKLYNFTCFHGEIDIAVETGKLNHVWADVALNRDVTLACGRVDTNSARSVNQIRLRI